MRAVSGRKRLRSIQNTFRWTILKAHLLQKKHVIPKSHWDKLSFSEESANVKETIDTVYIKQLGY